MKLKLDARKWGNIENREENRGKKGYQ